MKHRGFFFLDVRSINSKETKGSKDCPIIIREEKGIGSGTADKKDMWKYLRRKTKYEV